MENQQNLGKKHLPAKIWVPVLVVVALAVAYLGIASAYDIWPFTHVSPPAAEQIGGDEEGVDELASWQTYRNEEFGFEVRYPRSFLIISEKSNFLKLDGPKECGPLETGFCPVDIVEMKFLYNQGGLTAEDWFNEASQQGITFNKIGTKVIAGQNAIIATPKDTEGFGTKYVFTGGGLLPNNTGQYIFDLLIYSGVDNKLRDQILSTFQTTDELFPTQTIAPTSDEGNGRVVSPVKKVTVQDLATNPSTYLNMKVQVTGKLISPEKSYFPTEFAIVDPANSQIRFKVTAWLPFEVPPSLPGSSGGQPRTMRFYLDKIITVQGIVKEDKVETSFYLDVIETIEF